MDDGAHRLPGLCTVPEWASEMTEIRVKPLKWRRPSDHPQDHAKSGTEWIANGVGGRYCIHADGLLWWADDPFTWGVFAGISEAKAAAQEDHEKRVIALVEVRS